MPSPIERLIDQACGVPAGWKPPKPKPQVTLCCPECRAEKMVARERSDPARTAVIEAHCPQCVDGKGCKPTLAYFDAAGRPLTPKC